MQYDSLMIVQFKCALNHKNVLCVKKKSNISGAEEDGEASC